MEATRELIAALAAGGMDAASAACLVARSAVEMNGAGKSTNAIRQQRFRDKAKRNEALRNVTLESDSQALRTVTNRNEGVTNNADAGKPPLILTSLDLEKGLSEKKEGKKERATKKRNVTLPDSWQPPARAAEVAAEFGLSVPPIEARFRDYLKSSGKLYADHDAAFCNFIRMTPKFGGGNHGNASSNHRTDPAAGRATAREAQHVAAMGGAALRYLQEGKSAGTGREPPDGAGPAEIHDFGERTENAR